MSILTGLFASTTSKLALAAVGVAFVAGGVLGWHEKALRVPALLEGQRQADAKLCTDYQTTLKERNDALIQERARIAANAARYKLQHPEACLYNDGKGQLQPRGDGHAGVHGVSTSWLRDYAALCRTHQVELRDCANN